MVQSDIIKLCTQLSAWWYSRHLSLTLLATEEATKVSRCLRSYSALPTCMEKQVLQQLIVNVSFEPANSVLTIDKRLTTNLAARPKQLQPHEQWQRTKVILFFNEMLELIRSIKHLTYTSRTPLLSTVSFTRQYLLAYEF